MKGRWLHFFLFQERGVPCFWSDVLSTVWQIDFIWRNYESAYLADQLGNYMITQ